MNRSAAPPLLLLLFLGAALCGAPNPTFYAEVQRNIPVADLEALDWVVCMSTLQATSYSLDRLRNICGGAAWFVGCRVAGSDTISVGAWIKNNEFLGSLATPYYSSPSDNNLLDGNARNYTAYVNESSGGEVGFYSDLAGLTQPQSCIDASGSDSMCWNRNTTHLVPGGFCGDGGYTDGLTVERVVFSIPCLFNIAGGSCISQFGFCVDAYCSLDYNCDETILGNPINVPDCTPTFPDCHSSFECNPVDGQCAYTYKTAGTTCDSGNLCHSNTCDGNGFCQFQAIIPCPPPATCFQTGICDPMVGTTNCTYFPQNDGTPCFDGNPCTENDACFTAQCISGPLKTCFPQGPCYDFGTCNNVTGFCDDSPKPLFDPCTVPGNQCVLSAVCTGNPSDPTCTPVTNVTCGTPDDCFTPGTCSPTTGNCTSLPLTPGSFCNDGDNCFTSKTCTVTGDCTGGTPVLTCPPIDDCHAPGAPFDTGTTCVCTTPQQPDGTACDDGDVCTEEASCLAGSCVPQQTNACVPDGVCLVGPGSCIAFSGCSNALPDGSACDDGDECTLGTTCQQGDCTDGFIDFYNFNCGAAAELPMLF